MESAWHSAWSVLSFHKAAPMITFSWEKLGQSFQLRPSSSLRANGKGGAERGRGEDEEGKRKYN